MVGMIISVNNVRGYISRSNGETIILISNVRNGFRI